MVSIDNVIEGNLTPQQWTAITGSIKLGRTLQRDHPHIDYLWWQGGSYPKVVEMLDIQNEYGVGYNVARIAVNKAIAGHDGSFKIPAYNGLISEEERKEIGMRNNVESGRKTYEEGKGIHAMTTKERREIGRKNGRKNGRKTYEEGKGVHGRTPEQMSIDGRKANEAQGKTSWTNEETEFAYQLSRQPEYQWGKGSFRPGKPNNELIALELNIQYHNCNEVRNKRAVQNKLCKYRKSLADKLE